ncbi:DUF1186 domain-containing protein [Bradyrhizobium algeriense]|uniref:DUF1186 domain-containing protein n=1 Tax=Bradyrhizobium algeriense TaxID=634784 RepID=UPI0011AE2C61|nr:DUF1186 domain-containing protein [Bradyrhizobium algeriense]
MIAEGKAQKWQTIGQSSTTSAGVRPVPPRLGEFRSALQHAAEHNMKKEELEAILGSGENTPDLGPIEDYLHAIATEPKLPDLAVGMCTARIEEAAPKLRAVLLRAADGEVLSDDESLLLFRGLHILGGARDQEACQPLLRLLRRPQEELDDLLGDAVTESLAKIVTGVFDDDADALFALITDRSIDGFIREALFAAATFLAWERRIQRDRFREFLVRFHEERPAEDGDQAWAGWLQAIALLGLRDLVPLVDGAFREDRIPEEWIGRPQFDEDLVAAEHAPDDIDRFTQINLGYIEDVLVSLDWVRDSEDIFDEDGEEAPWTDFAYPSEPVRNPWRHVGRNDPCPCGSGRKAKKCCLANGEPPA